MLDYLNLTNPGTAALGALLTGPAGAPMRTAIAISIAVSVGASVASSVGASLAGGAAAGGASLATAAPALLKAQRVASYARLGGASNDSNAASADGGSTSWMSGSFVSFYTPRISTSSPPPPTMRRHLSKGKADSPGGNEGGTDGGSTGAGLVWHDDEVGDNSTALEGHAEARAAIQDGLLATLEGRMTSGLLCVVVAFALQYSVLLFWLLVPNRRFYACEKEKSANKFQLAKIKQPAFRGVPAAVLWPNPQAPIFMIYGGAVLEGSASVLGAYAGGYDIEAVHTIGAPRHRTPSDAQLAFCRLVPAVSSPVCIESCVPSGYWELPLYACF